MGPLMIGMVAVGVIVGLALGRSTERVRRSYKDYDTARTALTKGRQIAFSEVRKTIVTLLLVGAFIVALIIGAANVRN